MPYREMKCNRCGRTAMSSVNKNTKTCGITRNGITCYGKMSNIE